MSNASRARRIIPLRRRGAQGMTIVELMLVAAIVAILASIAVGWYKDAREQARVAQAVADITAISTAIARRLLDYRSLPDSLTEVGYGSKLDPWGHAYYYLNLTGRHGYGQSRKDRQLNPINSDYDLYSAGRDGLTQTSIVAAVSRDDVIRARNGQFIGLASAFEP